MTSDTSNVREASNPHKTTTKAKANDRQRPLTFLTLPYEIRVMVYKHYLRKSPRFWRPIEPMAVKKQEESYAEWRMLRGELCEREVENRELERQARVARQLFGQNPKAREADDLVERWRAEEVSLQTLRTKILEVAENVRKVGPAGWYSYTNAFFPSEKRSPYQNDHQVSESELFSIQDSSLFKVSKQIRAEAQEVDYIMNKFVVDLRDLSTEEALTSAPALGGIDQDKKHVLEIKTTLKNARNMIIHAHPDHSNFLVNILRSRVDLLSIKLDIEARGHSSDISASELGDMESFTTVGVSKSAIVSVIVWKPRDWLSFFGRVEFEAERRVDEYIGAAMLKTWKKNEALRRQRDQSLEHDGDESLESALEAFREKLRLTHT